MKLARLLHAARTDCKEPGPGALDLEDIERHMLWARNVDLMES